MPYSPLNDAMIAKARSRVMIVGPPNTRKTTSLLTWPRPLHVIVAPGEYGAVTLKHDPSDGVHVYAWEDPMPGGRRTPSAKVVQEFRALTIEVITGKYGPVQSLAIDGAHKFSDFCVDSATGGAFLDGSDFEPRLYAPATREFINYLNLIRFSSVPNVVITLWEGMEKDTLRKEEKSQHVWPDLPGKMAKKCLGEFTAVVFAKFINGAKPGDPPQAVWQLKPDDVVWGVAVKCPPEVRAKLPQYCPQEWKVLMQLLAGEEG